MRTQSQKPTTLTPTLSRQKRERGDFAGCAQTGFASTGQPWA
jgi:hypothetical protein